MSTGQCSVDPVTGIAGDIYNAWTGATGNGLSAAALVDGGPVRLLLATQVEAIAASINAVSPSSGHTLGASVTWAAGSGAGQYEFGAGLPNGVIGAITGCDEGGTVSYVTGAGTGSGVAFTVHFAVAFPHAPAPQLLPGDSVTAAFLFGNACYATTTAGSLSIVYNNAPPNATHVWHWGAKGRT